MVSSRAVSTLQAPTTIHFPTNDPECNDTERRSLIKINALLSQMAATLAALNKPGGVAVAATTYLYGVATIGAVGSDLLDVACYNPTDIDVWVMVFGAPPATGQRPLFTIRVYAHNHAYYEALTAVSSFTAGRYYVVVSSTESTFAMNSNSVFLAVRHS